MQCLISLCQSLSLILKKDQNDLVLARNVELLISAVKKCSLPDLVQLGEALSNGICPESAKDKKSVGAFRHKVSSLICILHPIFK